MKSVSIDMTIWQRIRIYQFKCDLQDYVSHLVHRYVSARTEFKNGKLTIYLIESELDLVLMLTYTIFEVSLARKSKPYRNEILKNIRNEISLGYPEIIFFESTDT